MAVLKICDTVAGGSVLASGAQPPSIVTNFFPVIFAVQFYCYRQRDRQSQVWSQHTAIKLGTPQPPTSGTPKFVGIQILFVCDLKPYERFENPTKTPSGGKVTTSDQKKERKRKERR